MKDLFKKLPLESPDAILDSVYSGEKSNIDEMERVLSKPFNVKEYLNNIEKHDDLTKRIYNIEKDDRINLKDKGQSLKIKLGQQGNIYHKESITDNIRSTVNNLIKDKPDGESGHELALMGVLSQEGKKYTAIYKDNGIEFDEPNKLSAYIAARRYKDIGFNKQRTKPFVVAIYNQSIKEKDWNINIKTRQQLSPFKKDLGKTFEKEFVEKFGDRAKMLTKALSRATVGFPIEKAVLLNRENFKKGQEIIDRDVLDIVDRKGIAPSVKDKLNELTKEKDDKVTKEKSDRITKDIQREVNEQLRLERERIRREQERLAWIEYEKEQDIRDRQLIRATTGLVTATVGTAAVKDILSPKGRIDNKELDEKIRGKEKKENKISDINREAQIKNIKVSKSKEQQDLDKNKKIKKKKKNRVEMFPDLER